MTGKERMRRIQSHVIGIAHARLMQFMAGTRSFLPCWGDEIDELIVAELDRVQGPLRIGLWFWETP